MSKIVFVVNEEKRSLVRESGELVFVEGDKFVDSVDIRFSDYFTEMDLDTSLVRIMYKAPGASEVQRAALTSFHQLDEGYISYTWDLGILTDAPGTIAFSVCLLNLAADGQTVEYEWHTTPASFNIVSTIHGESDAQVPEDIRVAIETQVQVLRAELSANTYKINNINGGLPIPVSLASEMLDESYLYLYMGNEEGYQHGYWYYYDPVAEEWKPGGVYASIALLIDETLTFPGRAADALAVREAIDTAVTNLQTQATADHTRLQTQISQLSSDAETAMHSEEIRSIIKLTRAEYDGITVKDPETLYIVQDD